MVREGLRRIRPGSDTAHDRLTIAQLAAMSGLTSEQLSRRLRGETDYAIGDLVRIANALSIEPWTLLETAIENRRADGGNGDDATISAS